MTDDPDTAARAAVRDEPADRRRRVGRALRRAAQLRGGLARPRAAAVERVPEPALFVAVRRLRRADPGCIDVETTTCSGSRRTTLVYALLALGLNVVGRLGGPARPRLHRLLRLRRLRVRDARPRRKFGIHWPALGVAAGRDRRRDRARVPARAAVAAADRRLPGDRDALLRPDLLHLVDAGLPDLVPRPTGSRAERQLDLTGGPNGIANVDRSASSAPWRPTRPRLLLRRSRRVRDRLAALYLANHSRTGRAWRALRDDSLAAR